MSFYLLSPSDLGGSYYNEMQKCSQLLERKFRLEGKNVVIVPQKRQGSCLEPLFSVIQKLIEVFHTCFRVNAEKIKEADQELRQTRKLLVNKTIPEASAQIGQTLAFFKKNMSQCSQNQRDFFEKWKDFDKQDWKQVAASDIEIIETFSAKFSKLEGELILDLFPADSFENQQKSLKRIQGLRIKNQELYARVFAEWINVHRIPIAALKLSWSDLLAIGKHLTYLNIRDVFLKSQIESVNFKETFPVLKELIVRHEEIETIGELPNTLRLFDSNGCRNLKALPLLPKGLEALFCKACSCLVCLPVLPCTLRELDISCCDLLQTIDGLPENLERLLCAKCKGLRAFPRKLPKKLAYFDCSDCVQVKNILCFPSTLRWFVCRGCHFTHLPQLLHTSLEELDCSDCPYLEKIPVLPPGLLRLLCPWCRKLCSLPDKLPDTLEVLACYSSVLKKFPRLPKSLQELIFYHSAEIQEILQLPEGLKVFNGHCCGKLRKLPEQRPKGLTVVSYERCPNLEVPLAWHSFEVN